MAIQKDIVKPSGITLSYHRVVSVNCITNVCNIIEVRSYPSASARESEAESIASGSVIEAYSETEFYNVEYSHGMSVEDAYGIVKGMEEYIGSADV